MIYLYKGLEYSPIEILVLPSAKAREYLLDLNPDDRAQVVRELYRMTLQHRKDLEDKSVNGMISEKLQDQKKGTVEQDFIKIKMKYNDRYVPNTLVDEQIEDTWVLVIGLNFVKLGGYREWLKNTIDR